MNIEFGELKKELMVKEGKILSLVKFSKSFLRYESNVG